MKLKKIVSLALAGVLAVSMLAGCSGKGTGNGGDGEVVIPSDSSIVSAVNNGQSVGNKVKINFTSDDGLDAALAKAVTLTEGNLQENVEKLAGIANKLTKSNELFDDRTTNEVNDVVEKEYVKDGTTYTKVVVEPVYALTEEAALKMAADKIDEEVAKLVATTYRDSGSDKTEDGDNYLDFTYTGIVSMASVENYGNTSYYVAYVINQTIAVEKLEK